MLRIFFCGEQGIRTPGPREGSMVFKTTAFDHSASSPLAKIHFFGFVNHPSLFFFINHRKLLQHSLSQTLTIFDFLNSFQNT